MKNRITTFLIIVFTSIILLANVAIPPHHHHKNEVCINDSHCVPVGEGHKHTDAEHNHSHHGDSNIEFCKLDQVYIIPSNQIRFEIKCLDFPEHKVNNSQLLSFLVNTKLESIVPFHFKHSKRPEFYSHQSSIVNSSNGLRAPPIV